MKNALHIALFALITAWSINVFAGDKNKSRIVAKEESMPSLESWQFSPMSVESFSSNNFEKIWMYVGKSYGYPKRNGAMEGKDTNGFPSMTISIQWGEESWLSEGIAAWQTYDNIKKFYVAGMYTRLHVPKDKKLTPEELKSKTLGYYQCVNAMSSLHATLKENNINLRGSIGQVFENCGVARIM